MTTRNRRASGPSLPSSPGIFSDDEEERAFISAIKWTNEDKWNSSMMPWNTIHKYPWVRRKKLGQGAYGAVYVGERTKDHKLFAVKSIAMSPWPEEAAKRMSMQIQELMTMRLLKYKYVLRCLGCGRSQGQNGIEGVDTLDIFMEYCVRGNLNDVSQRRGVPFEEDPYLRQYTYDILKALQFMHSKKVVHGDIKPQNLLLADNCLKLADWGGSKILNSTNRDVTLVGTTGYLAPEVSNKQFQDHSSDVFSLGCTIIGLFTRATPSQRWTYKERRDGRGKPFNFTERQVRLEMPETASPMCLDFLKHCLAFESSDRWTAAELLCHPFVQCRDATNRLPYRLPLPPDTSLLFHPAPCNPVPSDIGFMTLRVTKFLTNVPKEWLRKTPADPLTSSPIHEIRAPPYQPSPSFRSRAAAAEPSSIDVDDDEDDLDVGPSPGVHTENLNWATMARESRERLITEMHDMNKDVYREAQAHSNDDGGQGLVPRDLATAGPSDVQKEEQMARRNIGCLGNLARSPDEEEDGGDNPADANSKKKHKSFMDVLYWRSKKD